VCQPSSVSNGRRRVTGQLDVEQVSGGWGHKDIEVFIRTSDDVHLGGQIENIQVPYRMTHSSKDSQIPMKWAERTYEQLVNSPKRELKIFTEREGGVQHSSFDNSINAGQYIADWVAEQLGGNVS